jgi:L-talarate/galactarate dehydratase
MKITAITLNMRQASAPAQRISLQAGPPATEAARTHLEVTLTTTDGITGYGLSQLHEHGIAAGKALLEELAPLLIGQDAFAHEKCWAIARQFGRHLGWAGLLPRVYAAIDTALWDLKGQALKLPLHQLFGAARSGVPFFIGDVAPLNASSTDVIAAYKKLSGLKPTGVLVKIGTADIQHDADRVHQIRDGLGDNAWLGIAADGRYDLGTAMAFARFFDEEIQIDWMESPVPASDVAGYQRLSQHFEAPLAIGHSLDSLEDFRDWLGRGTVRILRPDPYRLGGITPLLKVATLAEAYHVPCVIHGATDIAVHLACGLNNITMVDWSSPVQKLETQAGLIQAPPAPGIGWRF